VILVVKKVKKFKKNVEIGDERLDFGDGRSYGGWLFQWKELFLLPKVTRNYRGPDL
jgi:hypothetical protein